MKRCHSRFALGLALLMLGALLLAPCELPAQTIAQQLQQLAWKHEFPIRGLEKLETKEADAGSGSLLTRVKTLLNDYDHAIVHASPDIIRRVIIIGKKNRAPEAAAGGEENVLPTRRSGDHHLVTATLNGNGAKSLQIELMIDTGASLVVLPSSKIVELGLAAESLQTRELQTAQGKVQANVGKIDSLTLGTAELKAVEVAFIDDESLGDNALLGMNVLGRYLFILDDERNELTLIPDKK
jgi:aspartyl protease family protein